jgi:hypothetical protein
MYIPQHRSLEVAFERLGQAVLDKVEQLRLDCQDQYRDVKTVLQRQDGGQLVKPCIDIARL